MEWLLAQTYGTKLALTGPEWHGLLGGGKPEDQALSDRLVASSPVPIVRDRTPAGLKVGPHYAHRLLPRPGLHGASPGRVESADFDVPANARTNAVRVAPELEDIPAALAHEIGHARFDQTTTGKLTHRLSGPLRVTGRLYGAFLGGALAPTRATRAASVGLGTAMALPSLVAERAAWAPVEELYKAHGATPQQHAAVLPARIVAEGSHWLSGPVATAALGLGAMGARELVDYARRR